MDLRSPPPKEDTDPEAMWRYADACLAAYHAAQTGVRTVAKGGTPDLDALEKGVQVLEVLRGGRLSDGHEKPTEDDIAAARHLVDLVRGGAPQEELTAAAQRVHRIMNRPKDPVLLRPREEYEHELLNMLRMRGVEPTEDDMRDVRRLAELRAEDVEDVVEARLEGDEIGRRQFAPRTGSRS